MAAMLVALARLAQERPSGRPTVVMACTVNEECGFSGALALASLCRGPFDGILPRRPDVAVFAEPTELQVVVAHKGVVRWRCHTRGRAAHSSRPEAGENAIYKMARALGAMERYQRDLVGQLGSHPLCGRPTMSVGTIRGGAGVNIVPDHCVVEIDRRLLPGEDPEQARRHLIGYLQQQVGPEIALEHDLPFMEGLALSDEQNGELAGSLCAVATEVAGGCRSIGVPYATDAAFVAATGVPAVVFGPGSIAQAHTVDEWIALDQLARAAEIYYQWIRRYPG
jgi:acetylornithine deacetylase